MYAQRTTVISLLHSISSPEPAKFPAGCYTAQAQAKSHSIGCAVACAVVCQGKIQNGGQKFTTRYLTNEGGNPPIFIWK